MRPCLKKGNGTRVVVADAFNFSAGEAEASLVHREILSTQPPPQKKEKKRENVRDLRALIGRSFPHGKKGSAAFKRLPVITV